MSEELPYLAANAADSLSNITGILAGFALTGFFLLLQLFKREIIREKKPVRETMIVLFLSFVTASLTSFLYASVAGYTELPREALYASMFPHSTFVITVAVLLCGLGRVISIFGEDSDLNLARGIVFLVVGFAIVRLCINVIIALGAYGGIREDYYGWFWFLALSPWALVALITVIRIKWSNRKDIGGFTIFSAATVVVTLAVAAYQSPKFSYDHMQNLEFTLRLALVTLFPPAVIAAWSLLLFPLSIVTDSLENATSSAGQAAGLASGSAHETGNHQPSPSSGEIDSPAAEVSTADNNGGVRPRRAGGRNPSSKQKPQPHKRATVSLDLPDQPRKKGRRPLT